MIPAEAVEAAARVILTEQKDWLKWDDLTPFGKQCWLDRARDALEAAAPYMLAGAWAEGATAGWKQSGEGWNAEYPDESTGKCSVDLAANPYMRDTEGEK